MILQKIISGGQFGADQGALYGAQKCGIKTGGYAPNGFRTERGNQKALLKSFGLIESKSVSYISRTKLNVQKSDGTLIVAKNFNSPGTKLTISFCQKYKKPYLQIYIQDFDEKFSVIVSYVAKWIILHKIKILNVAGNRESKARGIQVNTEKLIMWIIYTICNEDNKICI